MISDLNRENSKLIDRINLAARERGNIDFILKLDNIVELSTDEEKIKALSSIVKEMNSNKTKSR